MHPFLIHSEMLRMGKSEPWQDAMEAITGQREMSAVAIKEYFAPLMEWLQKKNQENGEHIGWGKKYRCERNKSPPGILKSALH